MDNSNVVNDPLTTEQASEAIQQEAEFKEETTQPAQPGSKTEPTELLKSLKEERERRRIAEEKAKLLEEEINKSSIPSEEPWSDEGKIIDSKVKNLFEEVSSLKGKLAKQEILEAHPELKDVWQDLEDFRQNPDNKGMNLKTAAKAFMIEKGMLEPKRKGLEDPSGGSRTPMSSGMSAEDVKRLRETDPRKYRDLIKKDLIKIE